MKPQHTFLLDVHTPCFKFRFVMIVGLTLWMMSCATRHENDVHRDLDNAARRFQFASDEGAARQKEGHDVAGLNTFDEYVAYALSHSPKVRAAFERWRASVYRIARARRLPEPMLEYAFVIAKRHRLGLEQMIPWPTKLSAGADAMAIEAQALGQRFDAEMLMVKQSVAEGYWRLWLIQNLRVIQHEQLELLRGLAESARARIATNHTTLADQQQIELTIARLDDDIAGLFEQQQIAEAELRSTLGIQDRVTLTTKEQHREQRVPQQTVEELRTRALTHPLISSLGAMSRSKEAEARRERADRFPGVTLGVEWETGSVMNGATKEWEHEVMIGFGLQVPLWQLSYRDSVDAAKAEASMYREEGRMETVRAIAEVDAVYAEVRDAVRRANLYRTTLLPQAEAAYASVLGSYATGKSTVSDAILAQRELLEIRIAQLKAQADYEQAWAKLEQLVGQKLNRK